MAAGGNASQEQLKLFISRVQNLEEEKKSIADDIRDVYAEAKANGFDTKIMRATIRELRLSPRVRREQKELLDTYLAAFGITDDE